MNKNYLVISCSLNPDSKSRALAREIHQLLDKQGGAEWMDLQELNLPLCDGGSAYSHKSVAEVTRKISHARVILLAVPIYNYDVNAAAKNLIELTGDAWQDKVVGFLCAAGGKSSYMSVLGFANSLMLDFRSIIIPRFVYADSSAFDGNNISDEQIRDRIKELAKGASAMAQLAPIAA